MTEEERLLRKARWAFRLAGLCIFLVLCLLIKVQSMDIRSLWNALSFEQEMTRECERRLLAAEALVCE